MDWIAEGLSQPRLLPRALPPRPRAGRRGDRAVLPPLREAQRAGARWRPRRSSSRRSSRRSRTSPPQLPAVRARASIPNCSRSTSRRPSEVLQPIGGHAAGVPQQPGGPRGADHDAPRLPYAEGQRAHGRADGPGRGGLGGRAGDEPAGSSRCARRPRRCSTWWSSARSRVRRLDRRSARRQAREGDRRHGDRAGRAEPAAEPGPGGGRESARRRTKSPSAMSRCRATSSTSTSRKPRSTSRRSRRSTRNGARRRATTSRKSSCAPRTRSPAARAPPASRGVAEVAVGARGLDHVRVADRGAGRPGRGVRRDHRAAPDARGADQAAAAAAGGRPRPSSCASWSSRFEAQKPPPVERQATKAHRLSRRKAGGREKRVMRDDIDQQLLPVFLEEAEELVPHLGSRPARLEGQPGRRQGVVLAAPRCCTR